MNGIDRAKKSGPSVVPSTPSKPRKSRLPMIPALPASPKAIVKPMSSALPGPRLRPHVKAHKCSALARRQVELGHPGLTCATVREVERLAAAGLGDDLLLANEVVDARRLGVLGDRYGARVTLAV